MVIALIMCRFQCLNLTVGSTIRKHRGTTSIFNVFPSVNLSTTLDFPRIYPFTVSLSQSQSLSVNNALAPDTHTQTYKLQTSSNE